LVEGNKGKKVGNGGGGGGGGGGGRISVPLSSLGLELQISHKEDSKRRVRTSAVKVLSIYGRGEGKGLKDCHDLGELTLLT